MSSTQSSNDLEQGLKPRHVTMLSIAGVIGAGLFVGSGHAIAAAGPAVLLAYAAAGTLVVLVMRMLAEMAVASPDTGSFSTYADRAIGHWAGFTIGWLYWEQRQRLHKVEPIDGLGQRLGAVRVMLQHGGVQPGVGGAGIEVVAGQQGPQCPQACSQMLGIGCRGRAGRLCGSIQYKVQRLHQLL